MRQINNKAVIVHGGAGTLNSARVQKKIPYLIQARDAAWSVLEQGKSAEEAVVAALRVMEASEYFNAGYGGYPNVNGIVLQDIGLMRGNLSFVSLLNVRRLIHPSAAAFDLLNDTRSLLSIWTKEMMDKIDQEDENLKERYGWVQEHKDLLSPYVIEMLKEQEAEFGSSGATHGTVGCVARDNAGNLAAATCTGGVNTKRNGRIGDSPIIGSGVFADNEICALSTTGYGESFLKSQISSFVIGRTRQDLRSDSSIFEKQPDRINQILEEEFEELDRKCAAKGGAMIIIPRDGLPSFYFNSQMASIAFKSEQLDGVKEDAFIAVKNGEYIR